MHSSSWWGVVWNLLVIKIVVMSTYYSNITVYPTFVCAAPQMYKHSNNKTMTTGAIAAMLSTILYSRRFFPYYVYNIIGGLDEEGKDLDFLVESKGSGGWFLQVKGNHFSRSRLVVQFEEAYMLASLTWNVALHLHLFEALKALYNSFGKYYNPFK